MAEGCAIRLIRPSLRGPGKVLHVQLDGFEVGTLGAKKTLYFSAPLGLHTLSFIFNGRIEKTAQIDLDNPGLVTEIQVDLDLNANIELRLLSGKSHMAAANAAVPIGMVRKKTSAGSVVFLAIAVIIALVVFSRAGSGGKSKGSAPRQPPATASSSGEVRKAPTDAEKAEALLETASEAFSNGDYRAGIEICDQIVAEYPETTLAKNIPFYLAERYAEIPHYPATDLMAEYDANVVNADLRYTDTVMIVNGIVSSIGKTNNDKNLVVILKSGTYFYGVQLNFKTDQADSVAVLREGDVVTAIGKCTGQSGSVLLVLSGKNVMIEDCIIIN